MMKWQDSKVLNPKRPANFYMHSTYIPDPGENYDYEVEDNASNASSNPDDDPNQSSSQY